MELNDPILGDLASNLTALVRSEWREVWAQGGVFAHQTLSPAGIYSGDCFVVTDCGVFWLGCSAITTSDGVDVFTPRISRSARFDEANDPRFRPRLGRVREFPLDLGFEELLRARTRQKFAYAFESLLVGFEIRTQSVRVLFWADADRPCWLAVASRDDHVVALTSPWEQLSLE